MAKLLKKNLISFFKDLVANWLEDFFIFAGVLIVLFTTYQEFGYTAGNYALGCVLLVCGLLIAKK